uniref:X8 domain-containing protein n=1 Tax=Nelumbo nucifera TaxID=4432 RepID=A0A822ZCH8_NELNU|nr:TPA_asm: hypothetical protein HUJ06_015512 [Nelumbo nucifera]
MRSIGNNTKAKGNACGIRGVDCSAIQPTGSCYNSNALQNHASYAFYNSYKLFLEINVKNGVIVAPQEDEIDAPPQPQDVIVLASSSETR